MTAPTAASVGRPSSRWIISDPSAVPPGPACGVPTRERKPLGQLGSSLLGKAATLVRAAQRRRRESHMELATANSSQTEAPKSGRCVYDGAVEIQEGYPRGTRADAATGSGTRRTCRRRTRLRVASRTDGGTSEEDADRQEEARARLRAGGAMPRGLARPAWRRPTRS